MQKKITGSIVIETALILPLLLIVFLSAICILWIIYVKINFAVAANTGARIVSIQGLSPEQAENYIRDTLINSYLPQNIVNNTTINVAPLAAPYSVEVSLQVPFKQVILISTNFLHFSNSNLTYHLIM